MTKHITSPTRVILPFERFICIKLRSLIITTQSSSFKLFEFEYFQNPEYFKPISTYASFI